jgi:hypothetical protein
MSAEIEDDSPLANIMTSDGDVSGYDRRYDSLEAISDAVAALAAGTHHGTTGPKAVEVDNGVDFGITLLDPAGDVITTAEITPGTYTINRVRVAAVTEVVGSSASSEANGRVYASYAFPSASWNVGDLFYVTFTGIVTTIGTTTTTHPDIAIWGRVVREAPIQSVVGALTDAADYTTGATASSLQSLVKGVLGALVVGEGTFTTSSATVPADTSRTEASNYWDGCLLMPLTGDVAFQPRRINNFNATGDVFTVDANRPFTSATGTVAYVIIGSQDDIVSNDLDHLLKLDGATNVYPENCATDSILAKILVKADPAVPSQYDNSTDSLEAIADHALGNTDAVNRVAGKPQIFTKAITSAANAGDVTVATVTTQPCWIDGIIVHSDGATTADLTNIGIYGGASKVITFINTTDGAKANIDAQDEQVTKGYEGGGVYLPATATIVITLTGTGATAVDLNVIVKYRACVNDGYLV